MFDDILKSLEGASRAEPSAQAYQMILQRIAASEQIRLVRRPYVALAAACLALLLSVNVLALKQQTSPGGHASPGTYQLDAANFDFYK